jgi:hypothetical protein
VRPLAALVLFAALAASACSSGSDTAADEQPTTTTQETAPAAETRHFTKAELPKLALQPSDAPAGMRYTKAESGPMTLLGVGIVLDDQVAQIRGMGIRGIYDATFDSKTTDVRLASRIWQFAGVDGAQRWFEKTRSDQQLFGFEELTAPSLGQDSWAARGNLGALVLTYAFRIGNVVVVTTYSTQSQELSASDAIAAAQKAEARLRAA